MTLNHQPSQYATSRERAAFEQLDQDRLMSPEEAAAFLARQGNPDWLLRGISRDKPIRLRRGFPASWLDQKEPGLFRAQAQPGECFFFQVAVAAVQVPIHTLEADLPPLRAPGSDSPPAELFCINFGGVDERGEDFEQILTVPAGTVQVLWVGAQIPLCAMRDTQYTGRISVQDGATDTTAELSQAQHLEICITVAGEPLTDAGDSEPWRLSRLRWLDSRIAQAIEVTHPYAPLEQSGQSLRFLGRRIDLADNGLPAQLTSFFSPSVEQIQRHGRDLLSQPLRFVVATSDGTREPDGPLSLNIQAGQADWQVQSAAEPLSIRVQARLDYDGYTEYAMTVETKEPCDITDIRLEALLPRAAVPYAMGLGHKGGRRPPQLDWHWQPQRNQDTLWLGDVNAGLMLRLKGENYHKPYMLIYYHYKPLDQPEAWVNGGQGGIRLAEEGDQVRLTAYSGARRLLPDEPLVFRFDLMITPVKPLNRREHWRDRYFHRPPESVRDVASAGANIVNIHHANELNPFINYPFFETAAFSRFVEQCHDNGLRAKLYYTIKELTIRMPEFWAFRSLGEEIIPSTWEIGESFQGKMPQADAWMDRHLIDGYIKAWRQIVHHGCFDHELEASVMVASESRFSNFFLEGLRWLLENTGMDGIYLDDIAAGRQILRRARRILDAHHPGCTIDLHSWNYFSNNTLDNTEPAGWANSMNLYIDSFAFLDRLWFGEGFDYSEGPDYWLTEVCGIPFGMMGEMLQDGGNTWRGMVFGMTSRYPSRNDPSSLWHFLDQFGIADAAMLSYWHPDCPVRTGHDLIRATVYRRGDRALIAVASWADEDVTLMLDVDEKAFAFAQDHAPTLSVPAIEPFQNAKTLSLDMPLLIPAGQGLLLLLA